MPLATIEEAIQEIRRGRMVILMDDKDRENEGDLCMAAEKVTPQAINFMATHGRGLICLPLTEERVKHLQLSMMVSENTSPFGTAFTVSVDATSEITTGFGHPRPHFSLARKKRRGFGSSGSNRRFCGSRPACGPQTSGRHLRNYEG
jgi:3,4-dihydroxy-2-butanone 4-phosphate synthase